MLPSDTRRMDGILGRDNTQLTKQKLCFWRQICNNYATITHHICNIEVLASVSVRDVCGSPESRRQSVKIKRFLSSFRSRELATGARVCYCLTNLWFYQRNLLR